MKVKAWAIVWHPNKSKERLCCFDDGNMDRRVDVYERKADALGVLNDGATECSNGMFRLHRCTVEIEP